MRKKKLGRPRKPEEEKMVPMTVSIPPRLRAQLDKEAARRRLSLSAVVVEKLTKKGRK